MYRTAQAIGDSAGAALSVGWISNVIAATAALLASAAELWKTNCDSPRCCTCPSRGVGGRGLVTAVTIGAE